MVDIPLTPLEPSTPIWTYKDIEEFHNRVRGELFVSLESVLPDTMIDMPEKAKLAEKTIKSQVTKWQEYKDSELPEDKEKFATFESCIVLQTAIYFVGYINSKQPKTMQSSSVNISYANPISERDIDDRLQMLLSELEKAEEETPRKRFTGFVVTNPR